MNPKVVDLWFCERQRNVIAAGPRIGHLIARRFDPHAVSPGGNVCDGKVAFRISASPKVSFGIDRPKVNEAVGDGRFVALESAIAVLILEDVAVNRVGEAHLKQ